MFASAHDRGEVGFASLLGTPIQGSLPAHAFQVPGSFRPAHITTIATAPVPCTALPARLHATQAVLVTACWELHVMTGQMSSMCNSKVQEAAQRLLQWCIVYSDT